MRLHYEPHKKPAAADRVTALTYFALVFTVSWGGVLIVVGPGRIPGTPSQVEALLPFAVVAMVAGPSSAGLLLTGLVYGRHGLREFLTRLLKWRVGARWYAVALLTAPLLMMAVLLPLSRFSDKFLPRIFVSDDKVALLLTGIEIALAAGFIEELGWTGFAVPRLRQRYGVLTTGLIVGVLWGAYHFSVIYWSSSPSGALPRAILLAQLFAWLPAYRVLMVWVYDRTGSLLVAMLMHAVLTSGMIILTPTAISGAPLLTWLVVLAAVLWGVVAAVAVASGGHLSQQPLRRRMA